MKNKLKNTPTKIITFIIYHLIVISASLVFMVFSNPQQKLKFEMNGFNIIGENIRSKMANVSNKQTGQEISNITNVQGLVYSYKKGLSQPTKVTVETKILSGSVIETQSNSSLIVDVGERYSINFRIGENSRINLDSLMLKNSSTAKEENYFNLVKGAVYFSIKDTYEVATFNVKTLSLGVSTKDAHFVLLTDGKQHSIILVNEGIMDAENFKTGSRHTLKKGTLYVVGLMGEEKVTQNSSLKEMFDWSQNSSKVTIPEMSDVLSHVGDFLTVNSEETDNDFKENKNLKRQLENEIELFKQENMSLSSEIEAELRSIENFQGKLNREQDHINSDIRCIETSINQCRLYSEKLLQERGFPRTHGPPRFRESIVNDLRKYLKEQEDQILEKEQMVQKSQELLEKRIILLDGVRKAIDNKESTQQILDRLLDSAYRR